MRARGVVERAREGWRGPRKGDEAHGGLERAMERVRWTKEG